MHIEVWRLRLVKITLSPKHFSKVEKKADHVSQAAWETSKSEYESSALVLIGHVQACLRQNMETFQLMQTICKSQLSIAQQSDSKC